MHDEIADLDPPADRTGSDLKTFGDLGDGEELDSINGVTTIAGIVHDAPPETESNVSNEA